MSHAFHTLYPVLISVVDLLIGGGLLYVRELSVFGLVMTVVGVLVLGNVVYRAVCRTFNVVEVLTSLSAP